MPDPVVDQSPAPSYSDGRRALASILTGRFDTYQKDRKAAEAQWEQNLRQYLGKYDDAIDAKIGSSMSRAYPKRTRVKCVSMKARLQSLLFPASEKNWSVKASPVPNLDEATLYAALNKWQQQNQGQQLTQEKLDKLVEDVAREAAEAQEKIIDDQLQDIDPYATCSYETLCGHVLESAVLYGPGIAKGPMTVQEDISKLVLDAQNVPQVVTVSGYRPYLEFVSQWDYFPDMSAKNFDQMEGEFQRHVQSKQQLSQMAKRGDFDGDTIRAYIARVPDGDYVKLSYETSLEQLGGQNANQQVRGVKYQLLEYWGCEVASKLRACGVEVPEGTADDDDLRYTAWVLGNELVKVALNPYPYGTKVYHQFVFEEDEVNLLGSGLPPIMRDSQLAVSSFSRMLIDNASTVCGPNVEVDIDKLSPGQTDMGIRPFKVWHTEGANGSQVVRSISFDSHIGELLSAMEKFDKFADSETFVSPATGGDVENVSGEALRTTGGASMIYANAALPFRDIVRNFDQFTVSVIGAMIQWNRIFNVDNEKIQGDVRPIATGSTSLMAKEVRSFALDQLAATLTPDERIWINSKALVKERLKVRDLDCSDLLNTDEQVQQQQAQQQQLAQQTQQQQAALLTAQIKNMDADTVKQLAQAQKNLDTADVAIFKTIIEALNNGATPEELGRIAERAAAGRQGSVGQSATGTAPAVSAGPATQSGQ